MATATYAYPAGSVVFHVNAVTGVREAIVSAVNINVTLANGTVINYNIAYKNSVYGIATVLESVLYNDIDLALAAYKPLVDLP
ncbi:MAG: hypothetical protein EO766_11830 [Hydrotalea sp. AMD]|uniref:hypothetical protein n=1 Tax=Hydrotalea sp. AMD TaxID=2501297 RepID=UPI001027F79D|nr:hypothetical protein [Hydrotalea sp. AMD]RWZ87213.1 MAG: hypothetical protein EO766_11830 [Hydrotalea sp. AMD]